MRLGRAGLTPSQVEDPGRGGGLVDLRRLRIVAVVLPILFAVVLELTRHFLLEEGAAWSVGHTALAMLVVVSIAGFALFVFHFFERAQLRVVSENHELAAVNAVSTVVQGELDVDRVIGAVLEWVAGASGAVAASVTVFGNEEQSSDEARTVCWPDAGGATSTQGLAEGAPGRVVEVPLSTGTSIVGRMSLRMADGANGASPLSSSTLKSIGHQLACAVHIGQLVAHLKRGRREGRGIYEVLLGISNQVPVGETLGSVVAHACELLDCDEAVIWLTEDVSRAVQPTGELVGAAATGDGAVWVFPSEDPPRGLDGSPLVHPVRPSLDCHEVLKAPVRSPAGRYGDMRLGRRSPTSFTARDARYVASLCDIASIAVTGARMRESERRGAIVAERERIAREMHDGLAQILGVTHLRLRTLASRSDFADAPAITREIAELAEIAEDGYRDVREAILGLRESSRVGRGLIDGLRAYLGKYSRQCGIHTSLEVAADGELLLPLDAELQVIRVIQEALTNVRKYAGATSVSVRICETDQTATVVIEDDGRGFEPSAVLAHGEGFGLHTMRERMELLGGTLVVDSRPGHGARVIASCPRHPRSSSRSQEVNGGGT